MFTTLIAKVEISPNYAFGDVKNLGQGVNLLVHPTFEIAGVGIVIYFLIGAFKWITSGGNKDAISSAQKMITHAIIGFVLLMFSFLVFQFFIGSLFGNTVNLPLINK